MNYNMPDFSQSQYYDPNQVNLDPNFMNMLLSIYNNGSLQIPQTGNLPPNISSNLPPNLPPNLAPNLNSNLAGNLPSNLQMENILSKKEVFDDLPSFENMSGFNPNMGIGNDNSSNFFLLSKFMNPDSDIMKNNIKNSDN